VASEASAIRIASGRPPPARAKVEPLHGRGACVRSKPELDPPLIRRTHDLDRAAVQIRVHEHEAFVANDARGTREIPSGCAGMPIDRISRPL